TGARTRVRRGRTGGAWQCTRAAGTRVGDGMRGGLRGRGRGGANDVTGAVSAGWRGGRRLASGAGRRRVRSGSVGGWRGSALAGRSGPLARRRVTGPGGGGSRWRRLPRVRPGPAG